MEWFYWTFPIQIVGFYEDTAENAETTTIVWTENGRFYRLVETGNAVYDRTRNR